MLNITNKQTLQNEIVITERVATTEFRIREIHESVVARIVRAEIELGPFFTETKPNGTIVEHCSGMKAVTVWSGDEYDSVRDSWSNADLLAAITAKINN